MIKEILRVHTQREIYSDDMITGDDTLQAMYGRMIEWLVRWYRYMITSDDTIQAMYEGWHNDWW